MIVAEGAVAVELGPVGHQALDVIEGVGAGDVTGESGSIIEAVASGRKVALGVDGLPCCKR